MQLHAVLFLIDVNYFDRLRDVHIYILVNHAYAHANIIH